MRRILPLAAALLLIPAANLAAQSDPPKPTEKPAEKPAEKAADKATTHVGKWSGNVSTEQGNQQVWLTIKKDGDKLAGTAGSQMGETPLYDITIKGDTLSAGATVSSPNGNFDVWYTLVLKGDALSGSIDLNFNGQKMSFPTNFKREP